MALMIRAVVMLVATVMIVLEVTVVVMVNVGDNGDVDDGYDWRAVQDSCDGHVVLMFIMIIMGMMG